MYICAVYNYTQGFGILYKVNTIQLVQTNRFYFSKIRTALKIRVILELLESTNELFCFQVFSNCICLLSVFFLQKRRLKLEILWLEEWCQVKLVTFLGLFTVLNQRSIASAGLAASITPVCQDLYNQMVSERVHSKLRPSLNRP